MRFQVKTTMKKGKPINLNISQESQISEYGREDH